MDAIQTIENRERRAPYCRYLQREWGTVEQVEIVFPVEIMEIFKRYGVGFGPDQHGNVVLSIGMPANCKDIFAGHLIGVLEKLKAGELQFNPKSGFWETP